MRVSSQGVQEAVTGSIDAARGETVGLIDAVGRRLSSVADDQAGHLVSATDRVFAQVPVAELTVNERGRRSWRVALLLLVAAGLAFVVVRRFAGPSTTTRADEHGATA